MGNTDGEELDEWLRLEKEGDFKLNDDLRR